MVKKRKREIIIINGGKKKPSREKLNKLMKSCKADKWELWAIPSGTNWEQLKLDLGLASNKNVETRFYT